MWIDSSTFRIFVNICHIYSDILERIERILITWISWNAHIFTLNNWMIFNIKCKNIFAQRIIRFFDMFAPSKFCVLYRRLHIYVHTCNRYHVHIRELYINMKLWVYSCFSPLMKVSALERRDIVMLWTLTLFVHNTVLVHKRFICRLSKFSVQFLYQNLYS